MANIKTKILIFGTAVAITLCGCETSESGPLDAEGSASTSSVYITETTESTRATEITEAEKTTEVTEAAKTTEISETEKTTEAIPAVTDNINMDYVVREYPDDKIVPAEWLPVYSIAEAAEKFDEIVSSDVSKMDTADAVIALANKNVIFLNTFCGSNHFWNADLDHPYYSENYKNPYYPDKPVYPLLLSPEYYTDIQEIYDLGSETYTEDELNDFYAPKGVELRKCFMKENGASYVDVWATPIWNYAPFIRRTYIEIVSETEDKCSFIWYVPDWAMLNEPEEGYEYFYYSHHFDAVYENGSWKLDILCHDSYMNNLD